MESEEQTECGSDADGRRPTNTEGADGLTDHVRSSVSAIPPLREQGLIEEAELAIDPIDGLHGSVSVFVKPGQLPELAEPVLDPEIGQVRQAGDAEFLHAE